MARPLSAGVGAIFLLGVAGSCLDATDVQLLQLPDAGVVVGQAYLDLNGNGIADAGDTPMRNAPVALVTPGTNAVVRDTAADSLGIFLFRDVPFGTYSLRLDSVALGDSLTVVGTAVNVTIDFGDTLQLNLGATYPTLSLAQVRAAAAGRRVYTHGIALNARASNGDAAVHLQEGSAFLRATNVQPVNVVPGDSVRLLGRTATGNGQPTLDQVTAVVLRQNAVFLSVPLVTIAAADGANGGALDAALVRIGVAEIGDTSTVGGHLRFWAHNGSDSLEIMLRDFLLIAPTPAIRPDTVVRVLRATGVLVPYVDASGARWRLLPRGPADIATETKVADLAITTNFDTASASVGDTVEIRVTARNAPASTHSASAVSVTDTIPAPLMFLSATATRGTYTSATHVWTVGDMSPGAPADTLWIRVQVTGPAGSVTNAARLLPLTREVESGFGANSAGAILTIF